jgi:hypothetical protein
MQSSFEWRRCGHWDSSAAKAWFSAYVLWHSGDSITLEKTIIESEYSGGDAAVGLMEGYRRESAVALELIIKAVIARKLRIQNAEPATMGVPATHDLPQLWDIARLPGLNREDQYRLLLLKSALVWSGRYPTPRTERAWDEETKELAALEDPPSAPGKIVFRAPITCGWGDFDRLYQIACGGLT